ncbi:MAG: M61 family metallopeptidase [Proteobacteria bacterium]|nr:M61 family metallopeptidase [Pseudomonadota bacterium]
MIKALLAGTAALALFAQPVMAESAADTRAKPMAVPIVPRVPDAKDVAYPGGPITLEIDASDTERAAYRVTETIPVAPGTTRLTLLHPQWIPGHHSPSGPLSQLVDVHFFADGKPLAWHRDPVEVHAFHVEVPAGARAVVAKFIDTSPLQSSEGRITMTQEMLNLQWDAMSLYPAGHYVRQIRVKPSVTFPAGWQVASALDGKVQVGNRASWAETDYEVLLDSPIFAGANFRRFDLGHNVSLDLMADKPADLAITPEHLGTFRALVEEGLAAYGSHHFDHYDLLLALTERMGGIGLEHHRSSENSMEPRALVDWAAMDWDRNVVAHEFSHSWDGKFRRPAKLWTPDYRQPMQGNLLWVYEGQNQFWGLVLAARSGLQTKDAVLGMFANYAGLYTQWPGRGWRSVEDTGHDPTIAGRRAKPFASLDRNEDYYTEGALVWLEADQIIREGTKGAKGLDDFAKLFFGVKDGDFGEVTYEFEDVAKALNAIYPYDWASFVTTRINTPGQPVPLNGIDKGGYRLVWKEEPNPYDKGRGGKSLNLFHSIGVSLDRDGKVTATRWDGPAFNAGLVNGAKILAVNGQTYDADAIKTAITQAKGSGKAIELIVQRGDKVRMVSLDYHDGLRWPWLEKVGKGQAGLDALLAPRRPATP